MGFREEIFKRIEKARDLPTLPGVFTKLEKLISNPNSSAKDVASMMKDDVAITAKLLKVANSAAFAGSAHIVSVPQAVARLGFKHMAEIAKSLSIVTLFKGGGAINTKEFWQHSLSSAYISEIVPRHMGRMCSDQESVFSSGLLHDIGIFVLDLFGGDLYRSVLTTAIETQTPLQTMEHKLMGTDHAEVGGAVLKKWGLPDTIIMAIKHHHEPLAPNEGAVKVHETTKLANMFCNAEEMYNGSGAIFPKTEYDQLQSSVTDLAALKDDIAKIKERVNAILATSF